MPFITFTCNVCGKGGMVEYENELDRNFSWISSILCHNRCADFMELKGREGATVAAALDWWHARRNHVRAEEYRKRAWDAIVESTKRYCYAVSKFYGRPMTWEPSVVEKILATPDKWKTVLNMFERSIRR